MQFIPLTAKLKFQHYYFSLQRHIDIVQHLIEIKFFCNTISVFTATFDQFNTPVLKKSINFLQKILRSPNL